MHAKLKLTLILKIISFWNLYHFVPPLKVLSKYVIIFGDITWINIFIIARRKRDANMHVFLYLLKEGTFYSNKNHYLFVKVPIG